MSPSTKLGTSRKETTARERATMIVQVQAGKMTVKEAAQMLEIAPKTYHQWEKRGLEAMMQGLTDREPGRPTTAPDPEMLKMQRRVKQLETHVMIMEKTAELRAHLLAEAKLKEQTKKKGRTHGRTRAQRRRLAAATPAGLGTSQPGDRDAFPSSAPVERPSEQEPTPVVAARASEAGPGAADPGSGNP
jgi:hypothetical protein